jgi:hypothetical protein
MPNRGLGSLRNFVWIWYSVTGSCRYDFSRSRAMSVTTSSCVGPSATWRSPPRVICINSSPIVRSRPVSRHSSIGCSAGISSSRAPAASISSRMIRVAFCSTRRPRGRYEYAPGPTWRIRPARSKNTWLGATASVGVSFCVGIRARDQRTDSSFGNFHGA